MPPPASKGGRPDSGGLAAAKRAAALRKRQQQQQGGASPMMVQIPADPLDPARNAKASTRGKTSIIMDQVFDKHVNPWDPEHIESPQRSATIRERIQQLELDKGCCVVPPRRALDEELLRVHSEDHLQVLSECCQNMSPEEQKEICMRHFQSVYLSKESEEVARLAAGSAIDLTEAVVKGDAQNAMAITRPPGHHAMRSEFNGFCLLNNVAAAARHALETLSVRRILIVDFDVHHGQGTQQQFYDDPRVLYFSIHRYEHGEFWPHLRESDYDMIGDVNGKGFNVNVPLNKTGMTDSDYMAVFHKLLLPLAYEFNPELVLVSAGFDAAIGCPEGEMMVRPQAYDHMVRSLMQLAGGKLVVLLEGGYFIESLAESALLALRALMGFPALPLGALNEPSKSIQDSILNVISSLRPYWKCLQLSDSYDSKNPQQDCHKPEIIYKGERFLDERDLNMEAYDPQNFYGKRSAEERALFEEQLEQAKKSYKPLLLTKSDKKVAAVYDLDMMRHENMEESNHPEQPKRVERMVETMTEYGLLSRPELVTVPSRKATKEEICVVHEEQYHDSTASWPAAEQEELEKIGDSYDSIYLNKDSYNCALLSAGSLLNVVDAVCSDAATSGVAVIRPPGHHAESDEACGFCIFNNVAIAAKHAITQHDLKRILILDWDVHHGNGIQNMFYDDPRVLYVSIHRYDNGTFFPGRPDANSDFVGSGAGEGFNVNIPWNGSGMGDPEYALALFNVVLPIAYQYDPELILVSAGFDAAFGDPLGHCKVSPHMYGHMTHHLSNLANGRVIVALEGGYNLTSISLSMTMCTKALLGDPMPPLAPYKVPKPSAFHSVLSVLESQSRFWPALRFATLKLPKNFANLRLQFLEQDKSLTPKKRSPRNLKLPLASKCIPAVPMSSSSPLNISSSEERVIPRTPYIPEEYCAAMAHSSFVNTFSSAMHSTVTKGLVDSKYQSIARSCPAAAESDTVAESLAAMRFSSREEVRGNVYIPNPTGSRNYSHTTDTVSSCVSAMKNWAQTTITGAGSEKPCMETCESQVQLHCTNAAKDEADDVDNQKRPA